MSKLKSARRGADAPDAKVKRASQVSGQLKDEANDYRAKALAGSVRVADLFHGLLQTARNVRLELEQIKAIPRIDEYAKTIYGAGYNMMPGLIATNAKIDDLTAWLETNIPSTGGSPHVWGWKNDGKE